MWYRNMSMSAIRQAGARVLSLFRGEALDREFDKEAQSHLDLAVEDYERRGMTPAEARRLARVDFGAVEAMKDAHRDARGFAWLDGILYDLRFALRSLRRDRWFTFTAIVMLALATGLNVTAFALMDTMLFRGFPLVTRNDRLLYMQERSPQGLCCLSYADFEDWRAQAKSFEGMGFIGGNVISFRDGNGRALDAVAVTISTNAFSLLGVRPLLGRDFVPSDEFQGAPRVAILSYPFWADRFGGRTDIVGHMVQIDKEPATIVGVMPDGFGFPNRESLWMPLAQSAELRQRQPGGYMAFGRLADGANAAGARAELETISRRLAAAYPATNRDVVPRVDTYSQFFIGPDAATIYGSVWAAAWFVLLIACANLANLTLARTIGRSREFSTRIALGAGLWRMIRQILTENVLLAGAGGALGWWIAKWGIRTWATATESQYQIFDYTVDYSTLAYLVAISLGAALLFGLAPVFQVLRLDVNGTLKGDARGTTHGVRAKYLSAALVAVQMALSVVLLSGSGILARSLLNIVNADVGVRAPEKMLIGSATLPNDKYSTPEARSAFFDGLKLRVAAIPGIESVAIGTPPPVGNPGATPFELEGEALDAARRPTVAVVRSGSGYFHVMGTTVMGRDVSDADGPEALPVIIVNRSFAEKYWPGQDPLGKRLRLFQGSVAGQWRAVVGVTTNIMQGNPTRQTFPPVAYVPFRQLPAGYGVVFARISLPFTRLAPAVRTEVGRLDADVTLDDLSTLKESLGFRRDRMDLEHAELGKYSAVAPIFAVIALLLAAVGLYAVIAHSVSQRTKEIGIRMALGGAAAEIRGLIFREGMRPVAVGLILGLAASLGVNRLLQSQLVGVSPYDPVTLAAAPAVLILVALLACQIPSRRAMRVDPAVALRHD